MANCSIKFFSTTTFNNFLLSNNVFLYNSITTVTTQQVKKELQTKFKFFSRNRTYIFLFFKPSDNICTKKH